MLKFLRSAEAEAFAKSLAGEIAKQLDLAAAQGSRKFETRAAKSLGQSERKIVEFKSRLSLNWVQRSRTANAFLWTLKETGCPDEYARQLTEWFVMQLGARARQ